MVVGEGGDRIILSPCPNYQEELDQEDNEEEAKTNKRETQPTDEVTHEQVTIPESPILTDSNCQAMAA